MNNSYISEIPEDLRVLLLTPTGSDATNATEVLNEANFWVKPCKNVSELCGFLTEGAAALLIAEEALTCDETPGLLELLSAQPTWSDIPLIIIGSLEYNRNVTPLSLFNESTNLTVLARPLTPLVLISSLKTALRARLRQYEIKYLLSEREKNLRAREIALAAEKFARQEAEKANCMKDEFLATVSHELRNPLNGILGFAQLLRRGKRTPEDHANGLEIIERNARSQAALIDDLLDISRITAGNLRLKKDNHDLSIILKLALDSVGPMAVAKEVTFQSDIDEGSFPLLCDAARVQQIIWNLLTNAVKFSKKGGTVSITLSRHLKNVYLVVQDTGAGIAKEFLPYVFERFRQEHQKINRSVMGLGLGLSIAKQLTEMQNGTLKATSDGEGKGATFTLTFPLNNTSSALKQSITKDIVTIPDYLELVGSASLTGIDILAVDDEEDSRSLLKNILEECGAKVRVASSAAEALSFFRESAPDILLSDLGMPIEDGYALIAKVRSLSVRDGGKVPAIALTAFAQSSDKQKTLSAGFQSHIVKPVSASELTETIYDLVAAHKGNSQIALPV